MSNYLNILTKGLSSTLNTTPIEDGKLRYTTDTADLYLDIVSGTTPSRIKITDVVTGYTEEQISEILAPLNKLYLASDTKRIYVFNGELWVDVSAVQLSAATSKNVEQPIWFSTTDAEQPVYDSDLSYNTSTKKMSLNKLKAAQSIEVGGLIITESKDTDNNKVVDFSFA